MDGAIPSLGADSTRKTYSRFQFSSSVASAQSLQSSLFEQLLSRPAPQRELASNLRSGDSGSSNNSSYRSDSANEPSRDDAAAKQSSSIDGHDDKGDVGETAEDKAEQGETDGQVALAEIQAGTTLVVESAGIKQSDAAAPDAGATNAPTADQGQNTQYPKDTGNANNPSATQEAMARSDVESQQAVPQLSAMDANAAGADGKPVDGSLTEPVEGQGADKGEQPVAQVQPSSDSETAASDTAESAIAQEGDRAQAKSDSHSAADARESQTGQESSAAASPVDRKPRGERREKWFERGADSSSSTFGAQHDSAAGEATQAASTPSDHSGAEDTAATIADNSAAMVPPLDSPNSDSPSLDTTLVPVGAALTAAETAAVSIASSSSSASPVDSASSLGGDQATTSTTAPDGVDSKGNAASAPRTDAKAAANETQRPDALTQAERVRLVQRVSRSFSRLGPMGGLINIKLHPPQLGTLNVQVRMEGRTMTAKLSTETSAARDVILESLPVLRSRLAEQGFEISSFQVEVADSNADAASGNGNPQTSFDQSTGGDGGQQASRNADYRRLAAQQRQQTERYAAASGAAPPREQAWQLLAGVDLQA